MRSAQLPETLLPKRLALPIYCSDPISSNAYATQEIILVLALGGASAVLLTPWIALVVVSLLGLVTLSYRQTCHAYPDGGGAYAVSRANLGRNASLVAAAALLVDYVMTSRCRWRPASRISSPRSQPCVRTVLSWGRCSSRC